MEILKKISVILIILLVCKQSINAQTKEKSPRKAAILSMYVPGAGQVYTKKYWKIPIIYSALIASGYYINENNSEYKKYRDTYLNRMNGQSDDLDYTDSELITLKDYYKRNREISIMLFSLTYILNIIDASVNAHLSEYEINEDISLGLRPITIQDNFYSGIALNIKL
ncbi:MAG: DUF5683 domain-containing protein [Flavobacteriales bacterium]|nr:DUF5683 domain-containing protein [Flavobacteriales bacterium]